MQIIHISAECYPVAKVGGLADVVGALPKYQNRLGHTASVVMPYYDTKFVQKSPMKVVFCEDLVIEKTTYFSEVLEVDSTLGYSLFLIRIVGLTDRKEVYGYEDDALRFVAFQRIALQWILSLSDKPDVVHCHDHHTGFIPFMMSRCPDFEVLKMIPTVLSIHNAQYQGSFEHDQVGVLPRFRESDTGLIDWNGKINPLAAAIKCAWRVNTVSPSYMIELQQKANGLERLLRDEKSKCVGILNGIDAETWNPTTDEFLVKNYTIRTRKSGRRANKEALCTAFGLDATKPLFGFVGRLVWEKGADILPEIVDDALKRMDVNVIILGSGSPEVERQLEALKLKYPGRYNAYIGYEERMSHQVYAGADFLLMPSRVEPCGLNQLYCLRYGCMPIVRRTGGLKDTVIDLGDDGFGICHDKTSVVDVVNSIERAVTHFKETKKFSATQKTMMELDHSWENAADTYVSLYEQLK
ncbi:MAG: starch synthase [Flavobacteriales bacterium]|jgi:starch synthase